MKYHDVSVPISPHMHVYEGDPPVEVTPCSSIRQGDVANVLRLTFGTHTGTHIDAPLHFFDNAKDIGQIPLEVFIGPALVVDIGDADVITREMLLCHRLQGAKRVLFKTRNSSCWRRPGFQKEFVHLSGDAASYLVEIGIWLVGIDYLSIERFGSKDHTVHRMLLRAEVVVLEGLDLSRVAAGIYELICLPLSVRDGDGAPCRVLLLEK